MAPRGLKTEWHHDTLAAAVLYQNNATAVGGKVLCGAAAPMYAPDLRASRCAADVVTVVVDTIAPARMPQPRRRAPQRDARGGAALASGDASSGLPSAPPPSRLPSPARPRRPRERPPAPSAAATPSPDGAARSGRRRGRRECDARSDSSCFARPARRRAAAVVGRASAGRRAGARRSGLPPKAADGRQAGAGIPSARSRGAREAGWAGAAARGRRGRPACLGVEETENISRNNVVTAATRIFTAALHSVASDDDRPGRPTARNRRPRLAIAALE